MPRLRTVGAFVVGVATIVAAVFTTLAYCAPASNTPPPPTTTSGGTQSTHSTTSSTPSPTSSSPTPPTPAVGQCLSGSRVVACDTRHDGEVVAVGGPCTTAVLVGYAGGDPAREQLRGDVRVGASASGAGVCSVRLPEPLTTSVHDALSGREGDVLRRCFVDSSRKEVGCTTPHSREAVAFRPAADTGPLDCERAAAAYLGAVPSRFLGDLQLITSSSTLGTTCWVAVRGANVLTASVRDVGLRALPLEAAP